MSVRDNLRESLPSDPDFRHPYADEILTLFVCSQIKVLREQREMSQAALAEALGTTQSAVSRFESTDYAAWSVDTLRRIARAFDVRLRITFEGFGSLWRDVGGITKEALERPKIEEDLEFSPFDAEVNGTSSVGPSENDWAELFEDMPKKTLIHPAREISVVSSGQTMNEDLIPNESVGTSFGSSAVFPNLEHQDARGALVNGR